MSKVGRNDPCPCKSGKKYKHCCYGEASTGTPSDYDRAMRLHELDRGVVEQVMKFAQGQFGKGWLEELLGEIHMELDETTASFLVLSAAYFWSRDDATPVEHFLASPSSRRLTAREHEWVAAQQRSWLSLWEVVEVARGIGFTVRDFFTGEMREVTERSATQAVTLHDGFLARIVDFEGLSVLGGLHPRMLPPRPLEALVKQIRKSARLGTKCVTVDYLREAISFEDWCNFWQNAVDGYDRVSSVLPELQNTDGDPLLITKDHFVLDVANRAQIEARLAQIADDEDDEDPGEKVFVFLREGNPMHKDWDNTVVGKALLHQRELTLDTNSIQRADKLRKSVEKSLGRLISHRAREHENPASIVHRARAESKTSKLPARPSHSPEDLETLREFKNQHYRKWLDTALPGLSKLTPRQAAKKSRTRADLIVMIKEMENRESRLPEGERFDMTVLWEELGLRSLNA